MEPATYGTIKQDLQTRQERIEFIHLLEHMSREGIESGDLEEADTNLKELLCNGIYSREVTLLKGTAAVGEIHKQQHMNILSKGKLVVVTSTGVEELEAPHRWIGEPGTKRAVFALTDVVVTTIHATENTSSEDIRKEFVTDTYDDVPQIEDTYVLGSNGNSNNGSSRRSSTKPPSKES